MKKHWKIGLAAICAAAALTIGTSLAAGGQNDPLVTLSYLKNIFTPQVQTMVDKAVEDSAAQIKTEVQKSMDEWESKLQNAVGSSGSGASFVVTSVKVGGTMTFKSGCEIVITSGAPKTNVSLLDQTDGTTLAAGGTLKANHLYLASQEGTLTVPNTAAQTGTVKSGPLNLRAGAGSSYTILATLNQGAVVTVLEKGASWHKVSVNGQTGYVAASYITLNSVTAATPAELMVRGSYTVK